MPYPLLLPALGLAVAGTGMQMAGARKARKEMNQTRDAEMARQKGYQREAQQTFNDSLAKSGRDVAATTMENAAQRRVANYNRMERSGGGSPMVVARSNHTVGTTPQSASGAAWSRAVAGNQAKLGATGDWQMQQGIKDTRAGQALQITADNARGSARLLPMELDEASHAGDELSGWGQILSAVGQVAGSASMGGKAGLTNKQASAFKAGAGPVSDAGATTFYNTTPTVANPWAGGGGLWFTK